MTFSSHKQQQQQQPLERGNDVEQATTTSTTTTFDAKVYKKKISLEIVDEVMKTKLKKTF